MCEYYLKNSSEIDWAHIYFFSLTTVALLHRLDRTLAHGISVSLDMFAISKIWILPRTRSIIKTEDCLGLWPWLGISCRPSAEGGYWPYLDSNWRFWNAQGNGVRKSNQWVRQYNSNKKFLNIILENHSGYSIKIKGKEYHFSTATRSPSEAYIASNYVSWVAEFLLRFVC